MLNTPKTFENYPSLLYVTYVADWVTLLAFLAEMVTKINHMGLISDSGAYLKNRELLSLRQKQINNIKKPT